MATKVKGEAIKEGSIPLSALADDVKDKIENAGGGADWNARAGEAGYIDNRTHYRIRSSFIDSYNGATIGSRVLGTHLPILIINDSINQQEIIVDKLDIEFNVPSVGPGIKAKITYDGTNYIYEQLTAFGVTNVLKFYSVFVQPLQDCFIPNTVIKTTPQTLSDSDKNQALTNLGIKEKLDKLVNITYSELKSLRDNSQLIPGQQYCITDYVTTTTQENTLSAGHQFDIIVDASNENTLNDIARACLHDGDTYFSDAGVNLDAWQIWYCLDNDKERFNWADNKIRAYIDYDDNSVGELIAVPSFEGSSIEGSKVLYTHDRDDGSQLYITENGQVFDEGERNVGTCLTISSLGKGVIYRMIDEWNNDCPYDFKNIQFNRGVYDGGEIAPDGEEDMTFYLFTFSFRTENNEIIDTSIFGNNGRLLNDEAQISGVYGNVIGQYMDYDGSIENPTKPTQRLNDIVFYSHYDYEGGTYYGCYSNSFGDYCYNNSFGNSCYDNSFGNFFFGNRFSGDCYHNSFGNEFYGNSFGNNCYSNSFGNACYDNIFNDAFYGNSCGNEFYGNSFGSGCSNNSFGNLCSNNSFGDYCSNNSFGNTCYGNSFGDYCRYNRMEDGVNSVELDNNQAAAYNQQVQNYHFTRGLNSQTIEVERNRAYQTTVAIDSYGNIKEFCGADTYIQTIYQTESEVDIDPNTYNKWDVVESLTLTLNSPKNEMTVNEYMIEFKSGDVATTLILPETVLFKEQPIIEPNKLYQLSIVNNVAVIIGVDY